MTSNKSFRPPFAYKVAFAFHPDIMHSGVTVSHITNEEFYTALIQMQGLAEATENSRGDTLGSVLSATLHPGIKLTLVSMSERTGMTVS